MPGLNEPTFVLSVAPRCGSTWVQRVLTQYGTMTWGEGLLRDYYYQGEHQERWGTRMDQGRIRHSLEEFETKGAGMWMALLYPEKSYRDQGLVGFLNLACGRAASDLGYPAWGVKETRWEPTMAEWVRRMWPRCYIMVLARDFTQAYESHFSNSSYRGMGKIEQKLGHIYGWIGNVAWGLAQDHDRTILVQYEDLVADWGNVRELCSRVGLEADEEPPEELAQKIGGSHHDPDLLREDQMFLGPVNGVIESLTQQLEKKRWTETQT